MTPVDKAVEQWNENHPIGTKVAVVGEVIQIGYTCSKAYVEAGGFAFIDIYNALGIIKTVELSDIRTKRRKINGLSV